MRFLLWTIGFHESTNFDTLKCSDEYFSNSSCHFPYHKSIFLQILHDSSLSWNITPLYFFRSKVIYFTNFLDFLVLRSKFAKFLSFLKQKIGISSNFSPLFIIMRHNSSVSFQLKFYMLSAKGAYQSSNLVKFHLRGRKSEILHFGGLLL